jgi:hypothetical protein
MRLISAVSGVQIPAPPPNLKKPIFGLIPGAASAQIFETLMTQLFFSRYCFYFYSGVCPD